MTDSSVLDKYMNRTAETRKETEAPEEAESDFGAFNWLRGIRDRAMMLQLRKSDGNILALSCGLLERAQFDPSEGITLHFVGQKIQIKGRNLNREIRPSIRLFEGLTRHRITWLQEADEASLIDSSSDVTVIESIKW